MSKKNQPTDSIETIIDALRDEKLERCAIILMTKDGQLKIGSFNIEEEVDMIELFQRTANYMIDAGQTNFTIH